MKLRITVLASFLLLCSAATEAHQFWPGYLQLRQTAADSYEVLWKIPASGEWRLPIDVHLPPECRATSPIRVTGDERSYIQRWSVQCEGGLTGRSIEVNGLALVPTDALVRIERSDGSAQVVVVTPQAPRMVVESTPRSAQVATTYLGLGIEHILLGIDHLLFVLALLIITRGTWRLVKTVTAFTVAHSITLALATLGLVHVPQAPVEAVIALSIVFVAVEIVRKRQGAVGITARLPWIVAFAFGLLHGFGFAGALSEIGLPEAHIPLALLFFNFGVELGQLTFIAIVLSVTALWRRMRLAKPRWVEWGPAYLIGSMAMFWVIDRTVSF